MKSQFATSKEKGTVKMEFIVDGKENYEEINENAIRNLIYVVRGQQVMLDSDLAMLYQVETGNLNKAMKRNVNRFPEDFCFQLTKDEFDGLIFQNGISNENSRGGRRKLPYVYTEQGISMLSAVLRSEVAVNVSVKIMRTFVEMRRYLARDIFLLEKVNHLESMQIEENIKRRDFEEKATKNFEEIFNYISEHKEVSQKVFFEGQIYDAFSLFTQLVTKAEKSIVLIDNYVDVGTLNILANKNKDVEVKVYTLKSTKLSQEDINNFNQQYKALDINYTNMFHDRFLIIDDSLAYHIGASLKDAGKKCFAINKIEDKIIVQEILSRLSPKEGGEQNDLVYK